MTAVSVALLGVSGTPIADCDVTRTSVSLFKLRTDMLA